MSEMVYQHHKKILKLLVAILVTYLYLFTKSTRNSDLGMQFAFLL
jgi:hypothetical protein